MKNNLVKELFFLATRTESGAEPLVHHRTLAEDGGASRNPSSYSSPEEDIHEPSKSARTISWPESNPRPGNS